MDSVGLARAITNYYVDKYEQPHHQVPNDHQLPVVSITGIQRRIQRALTSPSTRTWLLKLGWNWKELKRGVYQEGHERDDIKAYRQNTFMPHMQALRPRMMEENESGYTRTMH